VRAVASPTTHTYSPAQSRALQHLSQAESATARLIHKEARIFGAARDHPAVKEAVMSVYKVIDIIGTSSNSWEEAAAEAVRTVRQTIRDVRVAEVIRQDIHLEDDGGIIYRSKLQVSFKYEADR
jgi:flavin-binding protein dodecin